MPVAQAERLKTQFFLRLQRSLMSGELQSIKLLIFTTGKDGGRSDLLNFLDKEGLQSEVTWYNSMLSARELALIPTKGLSFERNEKDSLTVVISNIRYNSGTCTSKKRRISDVEVASISSDSSDEMPLRRNTKRRRIDNSATMLILGATPGDKSGTAVES